MNFEHYTLRSPLFAGIITLLLAAPAMSQTEDCGFGQTITTGCNADGTGYAIITGLDPDTYFEINWDGSEATGGPQQSGFSNGEYSVAIFDGFACETTVDFTIDCSPEDDGGDGGEDENCQFRTQTQGGWGSPANGNNPGAYRDTHFAAAFPNGLEIGCTNTLRLTSAAAVRAFLPSGSNARQLPAGTLSDPGSSYRNVLAGQLVALTLSLGFDAYDPAFGASNSSLANAVFNSGTFQGWRLFELVDEANRFIGGCGSSYSAAQLNAALSAANENFVDGNTDNGALSCSSAEKPAGAPVQNGIDLRLLDLPARDRLDLIIISKADGPMSVELRDAMGRAMGQRHSTHVKADDENRISMDMGNLSPGTYLVVCQQGDQRATQRFPVGH